MQSKQYWKLLFLLPVLLSMSCKKFLDVNSSNQVLEETMFKDGAGLRVAVNGVYKLLSSTDLYGRNLTYGVVSAMAYNYDINNVPYDSREAARFNWDVSSAQDNMEQIWQSAYRTLANCNNVIQAAVSKDTSFFAESANEKNMILGEMYGIRAMIHFDLLRIFCPAPVTGYAGPAIPYVTKYPDPQPVRVNMADAFSKIIEDLNQSRNLLGKIDTVYLRRVMTNNVGRIKTPNSWVNLTQGDFFNFRAERMNYFAATGLLARVYMYKGEYEPAFQYAKIVYDIHKRNWFTWTNSIYQGQITDVDYIYTKRPEELILSFSNGQSYNTFDAQINSSGMANLNFRIPPAYMNKLFEGDMDDYRIVGWYNRYGDQRYITWMRPKGNSYNATNTAAWQGPLLPVMRFSEMYHILIECYARQGKVSDAVALFNTLRLNRGAKVKISESIGTEDLMNKLVNDIIRENLTEGQTFFMFKRLNRNIFNGDSEIIMSPQDWYAPLPLSETAYLL
ncbi:RagB/SusD family nutrient uptake outer membrane protein [Pseudoflavitalea sp. G-6-1-2]|uniref:RagB/SusD family nutrient uptake outer membrane protein n=1 Tax=Pseudoflavitalea sp. G-6-1-2 TaxID=2728841 RepID=UPI00146ECA16|nr:RagB/SusD family nutrient uptake outer membrane protein [Pseudoflavitalea sp. G-6-1-2]NML22284.1 RagB/SusD family nutrient uptake outer membrane protein [Pseudoflavitalea sp. G-6-1-2]